MQLLTYAWKDIGGERWVVPEQSPRVKYCKEGKEVVEIHVSLLFDGHVNDRQMIKGTYWKSGLM